MDTNDVTMTRLDDQLGWYDAKATSSRRAFQRLKAAVLIAGGLIPVAALCPYGRVIASVLGFVVVVVESLQQLGQFQQNWLTYRSTAEALKHEKYLFLAGAGQYAEVENPRRALAERIESLVSQEHARWSSAQEATLRKSSPAEAAAPPSASAAS